MLDDEDLKSKIQNPKSDIIRISLPTPFPVGPVNVFVIKGDPIVLIDTGPRLDEAYARIVERLRELHIEIKDIGMILLTHGHLDHAGLLPRLLDESNAEAWAHPYVVRQYAAYEQGVEENVRFVAGMMRRCGIPEETVEKFNAARVGLVALGGPADIRHAVNDGEMVAGMRALHVPGHSAGDIVFHDEARRAIFTGDHVIKGMSPNPLMRPPNVEAASLPLSCPQRSGKDAASTAKSLVEYQHSLQRTRALDIDLCYPGHGSPFGNHREIIDGLFERHERRTAEIKGLLQDGPATPYALVMRIFPKIEYRMLHFGLSLVVGHLEILEERGEVKEEESDGVIIYSLR